MGTYKKTEFPGYIINATENKEDPGKSEEKNRLSLLCDEVRDAIQKEIKDTEFYNMNEKEREKYIMDRYKTTAADLNIQKIQGGDFMCIDGKPRNTDLSFNGITIYNARYTGAPTTYYDFVTRIDDVGFYNINSQTIGFVNEEGKYFIGYNTDENRKALEAAGYKKNESMAVQCSSINDFANTRDKEEYNKKVA